MAGPRLSTWDAKISPYLYLAPFFVVFGLVGLLPLLYTGYVSLFDWDLVEDSPTFVGAGNYVLLFSDGQFYNALANTLSILALSTVPQVVLAVGLAALLDTRTGTGWRVSALLPQAAGLVAIGIIFANLFGPRFGLVNGVLTALGLDRVDWQANRLASHVAIATMVNWRWTGYNALIVLAALRAIPRELHEAATVDGAGPVRRFTGVTLPLLRPTLVFVVVTSTIGGLQVFTEPKLFDALPGAGGGATNQFQTVALYLYQSAFEYQHLGYASAIAWVLFLVVVAVAAVNFRLTRRIADTGERR
ncbi:sugar ABC transporter permease [Actinokineospora sp. NBRC 105648]|uniref:carbohydrate ABC transporter permease n=1 Tax=Actinokineospora sp. NBRC 105648 TaxID=3032206 RepID=UPI0024A5436F|nr:sugar ABC transporter permease [Actinokineospora sp. NBRC 105648]GLZ39068.1 sugar ABC transporter permease [Actinokineospora sp. NBRC 105648]